MITHRLHPDYLTRSASTSDFDFSPPIPSHPTISHDIHTHRTTIMTTTYHEHHTFPQLHGGEQHLSLPLYIKLSQGILNQPSNPLMTPIQEILPYTPKLPHTPQVSSITQSNDPKSRSPHPILDLPTPDRDPHIPPYPSLLTSNPPTPPTTPVELPYLTR